MSMITGLRSLGLALGAGAAIVALLPNAATAQFWGYGSWYGGQRPWGAPPAYPRDYDEDRLRPGEIADVLREHGWSILSPPAISGRNYVANVRNAYGRRLFVVLDAYNGRILDARQIEERPDTNELAAIPGGVAPGSRPDEVIRPVAPQSAPVTPAPKPRRSPAQAKHLIPPPAVKSTPLGPPKEKEGTVAVARPSAAPPALKPAVPARSTPEANDTSSAPVAPGPGPAPGVRQVYPASGASPTEPPRAAEASPATPAPVAPQPKTPTQAKPPEKPVLPPDAGFE